MIVSFVSGTLGRVAVGTVAVLAAWGYVKLHYENKGAAKERAKIVNAGVKNAAKAAKVRAKVNRLPAKKLRDHYFRD